jgi:hypothetical protein
MPTISPNQDIDLIVHDELNRRYFPKIVIRPAGSFSFQPVPDCVTSSNIGRVGCIAIPSSTVDSAPPRWAGTLHTTPPLCNKRKRKCSSGIPIPRTTHTLSSTLVPVTNGAIFDEEKLPSGDSADTRSVAIGDMNNDGLLDILIGNWNQSNQLLMNSGDGEFNNAVDLPGGAYSTLSIAVADANNDGMLDIIVGNANQRNQLLMNSGDGTFKDSVDLPGRDLITNSIAVADMNSDGLLDIVTGNDNYNNQLLINTGDGTFNEPVDLPGGALKTGSVVVADVNNDGKLDIIIGNIVTSNQWLPYSSCPNGGAHLHSKSWCFQCPSFMGEEISICRECIPDYMQRPGLDYQCAINDDEKCPLGQRLLGEDTCSRCPDGTYYNNKLARSIDDPSAWDDARCVPCSPGEYATMALPSVNNCFKCEPGTYQPEVGAVRCLNCPSGEFQTEFGQDHCESCSKGGYCDAAKKLNGGFTPCPPGTYNDKIGQNNEAACQLCPSGTYSTTSGGNSVDVCRECPPGTYSGQPGRSES